MGLPALRNKLLFISHDASRTGAPIVLLHHLSALKRLYPDLYFDILLKEGGELAGDFSAIAPTLILPKATIIARIKRKIFKRSGLLLKEKQIIGTKYKLIYGNTAVTADILATAKKLNPYAITVCHVHELDIAIKQFFGKDNFLAAIPFIDNFIAASNAVKDVLTSVYNIPANKIHIHHEHIPIPKSDNLSLKTNTVFEDTIKDSYLKICGSGTLDWRKGIDLFIHAAYLLNQSNSEADFHFYWVGGRKNTMEFEKANYDIQKSGMGHRITIIESNPDPLYYMSLCDVFFLSSREDPFPLVGLEAAALSKPVICFDGSGGMVEFVDENNGWVINYLDLLQLNNVLKGLLENPDSKKILLQKGHAGKLKTADYDIEKGVIKLKSYLDNLMSN